MTHMYSSLIPSPSPSLLPLQYGKVGGSESHIRVTCHETGSQVRLRTAKVNLPHISCYIVVTDSCTKH